MESKVDIWMPLAIGDYLADTSHLDTTQHGAYLLLLMHYWRKGPLPNDAEQLANITKLSKDAWSSQQAVLMNFFTLAEDGLWHQKRSDREREKWMKTRQTAQHKASNAAKTRWENASSNASGTSQAQLVQCPLPKPLPIPLPTPSLKEKLPDFSKNEKSLSNGKPLDDSPDFQLTNDFEFEDSAAQTNSRKKTKPELDKAVREVFAYYCTPQRMNRNPAIYTLTPLRMQKGLMRLNDALRIAHGELNEATMLMKAAVDEIALSDWHMGRDERTNGKHYCEWEKHLFRSTEQFEKWIQVALDAEAKGTKHG